MSEIIEMDLNKAIKNKIDRSKWVKWKFTDLVENIVEKVVPKDSRLKHYIGLEHLDPGSLKIRRFGETSSLIGDKLKIYKGDLIFAKRNAYLKRVAIADFDAVASAHSMVLRPKVENVLPEFLPFFLLSEQFWQRAIEISVGSLSPTINWKSLAKQEFFLPLKEEQAKLAKLLWTMNKVIERENIALEKLNIAKSVLLKSFFTENTNEVQLIKIGEIVTGSTPSTKNSDYWDGNIQFITPADLQEQIYIGNTERYITEKGLQATREIPPNSVMVVCIASVGKMGISTKRCSTNQQINTIIPSKDIDPKYLFNTLNLFRHRIISRSANSVVPILNKGDFGLIKMPILEKSEREDFVRNADKFDLSIINLKNKFSFSNTLQKSLINQIF